MTHINLRHLYCFCEVVRRKSINAASVYVCLSQPAVTQALAKLETDLGAQLFFRRSTGMYPTEAGDIYYSRIKYALDLIERGAKEAQSLSKNTSSTETKMFYRMVTARQLLALVAVFKAGSFNLAARFGGISKSSIHRHVRDLERLSGITLFENSKTGVTLTKVAGVLVRYVKLAFTEIENAKTEIDAIGGKDTGRIVIGAMPLSRTYILPKAVAEFLIEFPDHQIGIHDGPYEYLLDGLRNGDIDLLLGALRDPMHIEDVDQNFLLDDPLVIVASAQHPILQKKQLSITALMAYPWVTPRDGRPLRTRFDALFKQLGKLPPKRIVECSSYVAMRGLLLESDFLALMSPHQVHYEVGVDLLSILPFPVTMASRKIAITTRDEWMPTSPQERFVEILHAVSAQPAV